MALRVNLWTNYLENMYLKLDINTKFIKQMSGNLQVGMVIRGCMEDSEIWTSTGVKLNNIFKENLEKENAYYKEFLIPLTEFNNPFMKDSSKLHLFKGEFG